MRKLIIAVVVLLVIGARARARGPKAAQPGDAAKHDRVAGGGGAGAAGARLARRERRCFRRRASRCPSVSIGGPQVLTAEQIIVGAGLKALFQRRVEEAVVRVRNGRIALDAAATSVSGGAAPEAKPAPRPPDRAEAVSRRRHCRGHLPRRRRVHDRVSFGNQVRERRRGGRRQGAAPRHGRGAERRRARRAPPRGEVRPDGTDGEGAADEHRAGGRRLRREQPARGRR